MKRSIVAGEWVALLGLAIALTGCNKSITAPTANAPRLTRQAPAPLDSTLKVVPPAAEFTQRGRVQGLEPVTAALVAR